MKTCSVEGNVSWWIFDGGPLVSGPFMSMSENRKAPSCSLHTGPSTNTNPSLISVARAGFDTGTSVLAPSQKAGKARGAAGGAEDTNAAGGGAGAAGGGSDTDTPGP